nr:PaaI family thioesterase [Stakelama flava]
MGQKGRFNDALGPLSVKVEGDIARVRMAVDTRHSNLADNLHGGALLAFVDVAMFAAARGFDVLHHGGAVTLDVAVQFMAAGSVAEPIEARVELLRETGRLLFLRGLIVQDHGNVANFSGTVRKVTGK